MPELPEVETIVRDLRQDIVGQTVTKTRFLTRSVWYDKLPSPAKLKSDINAIDRRGKNILISLSNGHILAIHLKMTGRLTFESGNPPIKKHTHFIMDLASGAQVRFNDIRRFGYLDLFVETDLDKRPYIAALGPDALAITCDDFIEIIKTKNRIIKSLLLDQSVIAGLGNIYSDEALYFAGINPRTISSRISKIKAARLYNSVIDVLKKAIASRGSSIDDYVDGRGAKGSFQNSHMAYGREGEPCKKCGRPIVREVIGSRSAHYCPRCQR
jgi:formamidopyrimidine-DNA glycosylase